MRVRVRHRTGLRNALERGRPPRLGAGLAAWWTSERGFAAAQWNDQSGNARHLLQAVGASQPTSVASQINGRPVVRTDGVDDFMQALFALNQPCTIFGYPKINVLTAGGGKDFAWDGGAATAAVLLTSDPLILLNAGAAISTGTLPTTGAFVRMVAVLNGVTSSLQYAGAPLLAGAAGANNPGGFTLSGSTGGTRTIGADWPEVWIANHAVSQGMISRAHAYMRARGAS